MGHSQAQKAETHARIVAVAARRFRERGLDGIGVADVMKEAGVTVGGFYKHFASREELVVEAIATSVQSLERRAMSAESLLEFIDVYLSKSHRDEAGDGCALAALAGDVGRCGAPVQKAYAERLEHMISFIASLLPEKAMGEEGARRDRATSILSSCLGALSLARAVDDPALADRILATMADELKARSGVAQ